MIVTAIALVVNITLAVASYLWRREANRSADEALALYKKCQEMLDQQNAGVEILQAWAAVLGIDT